MVELYEQNLHCGIREFDDSVALFTFNLILWK